MSLHLNKNEKEKFKFKVKLEWNLVERIMVLSQSTTEEEEEEKCEHIVKLVHVQATNIGRPKREQRMMLLKVLIRRIEVLQVVDSRSIVV